jgi:hypothetical protein
MKIILGTFKDNADELAEFLGPRLGTKAEVSGGELNFEDDKVKKTVKPRHAKTYIKRFLNKKGERANYQIQVEGKQLRLIELEREEEEEEKEEKKKEKATPKLEEKAEKAAETKAEEKPAVEEEAKEEASKAEAKEEEPAKPKKAKKTAAQQKPSSSSSS